MATDIERLSVLIEANTKSYERAMVRLEGKTDKAIRASTRSIQSLDGVLKGAAASAARFAGAFGLALSGRAVIQAADAFTRIQNSLKVAGLEGEALAGTLQTLFEIAQKNGTPLESLADLYGKVAGAQKELNTNSAEMVTLTEAVSNSLKVSGTDAATAGGALRQLSQALAGGKVQAEEYNSLIDGLRPLLQAAADGMVEAGGSIAKLTQLVKGGKVSSEAFYRAILAGSGGLETLAATADGTIGQALERLKNTLQVTVGGLDDNSKASEFLIGRIDALGQAIVTLATLAESKIDTFVRFGDALGGVLAGITRTSRMVGRSIGAQDIGESLGFTDEVENRIRDAADAVDAFKVENDDLARSLRDAANRKNTELGGSLIAGPAPGGRIKAAFEDGAGTKQISLADFRVPSTGKSASESRAEREKKAVTELIAELERERSLIGATDTQRAISNELRRAGSAATDEQRQKIERLVTQIETENLAHQRLIDAMDEMRDAAGGTLSAFNQALRDGEGLAGGLKSALDSVLDTVIKIAEQQAINALFGASGTAGGGVLGKIAGSLFGGAFADGGVLGAGKWGIAGEEGPEIIRGPATIQPISNDNRRGGGTMTVHVDLSGANGDAAIEAAALRAAHAGAQMAISEVRQNGAAWAADRERRYNRGG